MTLADVRGFIFSHFATRTVYNTVDLYAVYAAIFVQNRVFATPPAFDAPVRERGGGSGRNIAILFGTEKLEWLGYPTYMVKKFRSYLYTF